MRKLLLKLTGYSLLSRAELQAFRRDALLSGKEIGILTVLRYNQQTLSPAKFKESAKKFDFEALDSKYQFNPLLEKPHEIPQDAPQG
jgi:hypothetical protein